MIWTSVFTVSFASSEIKQLASYVDSKSEARFGRNYAESLRSL